MRSQLRFCRVRRRFALVACIVTISLTTFSCSISADAEAGNRGPGPGCPTVSATAHRVAEVFATASLGRGPDRSAPAE